MNTVIFYERFFMDNITVILLMNKSFIFCLLVIVYALGVLNNFTKHFLYHADLSLHLIQLLHVAHLKLFNLQEIIFSEPIQYMLNDSPLLLVAVQVSLLQLRLKLMKFQLSLQLAISLNQLGRWCLLKLEVLQCQLLRLDQPMINLLL